MQTLNINTLLDFLQEIQKRLKENHWKFIFCLEKIRLWSECVPECVWVKTMVFFFSDFLCCYYLLSWTFILIDTNSVVFGCAKTDTNTEQMMKKTQIRPLEILQHFWYFKITFYWKWKCLTQMHRSKMLNWANNCMMSIGIKCFILENDIFGKWQRY